MGYMTPGDFPISSSYDDHKNRKPASREPGTDFALPYGTDIRMAESGVIVITDNDNNGAEGRRLELIMDNGEVIDYLHCSKIMGKWNQRVVKGQTGIALSGASGMGKDWFYGPHTHVTRRATPGLPYASSIDFMLAVDNGTTTGNETPIKEEITMKVIEVWTCPAWEAANQRVITNGMACQTIPAGWTPMLIAHGAEFTSFDLNDDMLTAVQMVWDLSGLSADEVAKKMAELKVKAGVAV
jgi:hypothetical protein